MKVGRTQEKTREGGHRRLAQGEENQLGLEASMEIREAGNEGFGTYV
jgi:hypothetical protein